MATKQEVQNVLSLVEKEILDNELSVVNCLTFHYYANHARAQISLKNIETGHVLVFEHDRLDNWINVVRCIAPYKGVYQALSDNRLHLTKRQNTFVAEYIEEKYFTKEYGNNW